MKDTILLVILLAVIITGCASPYGRDMARMEDHEMPVDMETGMPDEMPDAMHDNELARGMHDMGMDDAATGGEIPILGDFLPQQDGSAASARPTLIVKLDDGDTYKIRAGIVQKRIGEKSHIMYAYNNMIPGPAIRVRQGSSITVEFDNGIDMETTIHWHGVRLDNANDGVPGVTQQAVKPGTTFTYSLTFPDEGVYWYHPHVREDNIQQDLGLYGNIIVDPVEEGYYPPADAEQLLILDDILIDDGVLVPYGKDHATHALMGRFGNTMLTNGETEYKMTADTGSIVRLFITNVANTRTFNISIPGARMRLVGADIGAYEHEEFVENIVITSAERTIIDVLFDTPGVFPIMHTNPHAAYILGTVTVKDAGAPKRAFSASENRFVTEDIAAYEHYFNAPINHQIDLSLETDHLMVMGHMKPIEWEDTMPMINAQMTSQETRWKFVDKETGEENMDISYRFDVGDVVKIRLFNDPNSAHPMHHPIHFHGQRFLVISQNGKRPDNLVWKDTVLVPAGEYVDILLDATNKGKWMAHCHIAEHLTSGMMMMFEVVS